MGGEPHMEDSTPLDNKAPTHTTGTRLVEALGQVPLLVILCIYFSSSQKWDYLKSFILPATKPL